MSETTVDYYKLTKRVGWASFFLNCSSLIVFSYFAVYLKKELKISFSQLGFLDGCVDFLSYLMRLCSGVFSDLIVNRKVFFLIGVLLVVLAKPLEAIFRTFTPMFCTKVMERIGNGIQATPRDALVTDYGDSVTKEERAKYFGTRQAMGSMGSLVGSILACVLFYVLQDFQTVFWTATPVGLIAVMIICFGVKNKYSIKTYKINKTETEKKVIAKFKWSNVKKFDKDYWVFLGITSVYFIAKVSDSMALLYSISSRETPIYCTPLYFVVFHIGAMSASYLMGVNRRKIGKQENILIYGTVVFITALILLLYFNHNLINILLGMGMLGAYSGIANGMFPGCVSNMLVENLRSTGHGIYNLTSAIALLIGGSFLGIVSDKFGQARGLLCSLCLASVSLLFLFVYTKKRKHGILNIEK